MTSQKLSPWSSTGAGAVDIAQQVEGRLGTDREQSHWCWEWRWGRLLDSVEMSPNAVIEPKNLGRLNITGAVNGAVFMGLDQRCDCDRCGPQEQFQQTRFQCKNLQ